MAPRVEYGKSDAELVAEALLGAKEPFAELVTRHFQTAVALATRVLGTAELARDAAQEATVSAMTSLDRLRSPDRFRRLVLRHSAQRGAALAAPAALGKPWTRGRLGLRRTGAGRAGRDRRPGGPGQGCHHDSASRPA